MRFPSGTIARVDLTSRRCRCESLTRSLRQDYIGGRGINDRLLYDAVAPGTDPLGPDNRLIFGAGALSGTNAPSAARFTVTTKSPLTGILGDGNAGGRFGPALRKAGFDHLVIEGAADEPVYLLVTDGQVTIRPAGHLWGRGCRETETLIKQELGDTRIRVAAIGPAGEHRVLIASILHEDRAAARTGIGAVMGAKNLKAIAVRGTGTVPLHDSEAFTRLARQMQQRMAAATPYDGFRKFAGIAGVAPTNRAHVMAVRNFQQAGDYEGIASFDAQAVARRFYEGSRPCFACPIGCGHKFRVKDGPFAGEWGDKIEEGAFTPLGPVCGNANIDSVFKMNNMGNSLGLDLIEFGQAMAVVMDWYSQGIVTQQDLDGIAMPWGNYTGMMQLMEKTARREGVGNILADGIVRAAEAFGPAARRAVSHAKGMVMAGIEPRMIKGSALGMATSTRGADHLRSIVPIEFTWFNPATEERARELFGAVEVLDPLSYAKALPTVHYQNQGLIIDMLQICLFAIRGSARDCPMSDLAALYSHATGIPADEAFFNRAAERVYTLERAFICREGIRRADDRLIGKWADEPLPSGPYTGERLDPEQWESMLDDYYALRGWQPDGVPRPDRLIELGLDDVRRDLGCRGILPADDGPTGAITASTPPR